MATGTPGPPFAGGVTVLGNLAVDHIDDGPRTPGGCGVFAALALAAPGRSGRLVLRAGADDLPLFADILASAPVPVSVLPSDTTSAFTLRYRGESRTLVVDRIGPSWTPLDIAAARITTEWVHVAPLLRSDFPADAIEALHAAGHRISYDGQGLVRAPVLGRLVTDDDYDPRLLSHLHVLSLSADEAADLLGDGHRDAVRRLGVPEVLVTRGTAGCDVYVDGERTHVPVAWRVDGVQSTGAGDMFTVTYVAARSRGTAPVPAAIEASHFVATQLTARHDGA